MERHYSTQQITWFLDLNTTGKLDLDPPYQRKSVWTLKDRQYFLDSIFKNYPCPAIFVHVETDENGKTTHHIVDGKQRLQTILMFANNQVAIGNKFGDADYDGKKFEELKIEQRKKFWDYVMIVDFVDLSDTDQINQIFDRLNRNQKNLNPQELRHAKFNGWFISESERETENSFWQKIKVSTISKSKRMKDVQFISELLMVIIEDKIAGFDQDHMTEIYASYENKDEVNAKMDLDQYLIKKEKIRNYINEMEDKQKSITTWATTANNLYTLWSLITLEDNLPPADEFASKFNSFMEKIANMNKDIDSDSLSGQDSLAYTYFINSRGASTDLKQRIERLIALKSILLDS